MRRFIISLFWLVTSVPMIAAGLPAHPRVLVNEAELAALRPQLLQRGWKRQLYRAPQGIAISGSGSGIRSNAEWWLQRPIEIPARGGHYHYYFCDDGSRLALPPHPEMIHGPYHCPSCGRQYEGDKFDAAYRRIYHAWLAQAARDLALVYALEQRPECAAKAAEILLKYAEAYPGPHTGALTGGMLYQSLCESMWVIPLAQAYDLVYAALTESERVQIGNFLETVAGGIRGCGVRGNWGSWHLSAVGVVGYATGNRDFVDWTTAEFKRQIRAELGDDGLWPESVHTYHYFPLQAFLFFAEAAWHAGDDLYHWEAKPGKSLLAMLNAPLDYAYPDLRLPAINDGWFEAFVPPDFYELAQHRAPDPRFAWVLANGYHGARQAAGSAEPASKNQPRSGLYAFLFGGDLPTNVGLPATRSANFPVLGIAALRSTNGAMLTFDYGPFLGHGHLDKMGITLFANGRLWAADYGTPGYGAGILPWYQGTRSHNTIVVDGNNQQRTQERLAEVRLGSPENEAISAETSQASPGVTHRRTVARAGDCFVIVDTLRSDAAHVYDFYLHAEGKFSLSSAGEKPKVAASLAKWIEQLQQWPAAADARGNWREGRSQLAFWLSGSGPVTLLAGRCPAESGTRKVTLLIARQTVTNAQFVTVLRGCPTSERLTVERSGDELRVVSGRTEHRLRLAADGGCPDFLDDKR